MNETECFEFAKNTFSNSKAYRSFVKSNGYKSLRDFPKTFKELPITNKINYLEKYSIEERLIDSRSVSDYYMVCTSSGTTGEPTIWPRDYKADKKAIEFNYWMYNELFDVDKKRTLVVVTFGLGAWTAGMLTSRLCWEMPKTAKVTVVTPGLDKEVSLKVLQQLSKYFDQTIITGYPPFLIDLIDYGYKKGFDFKSVNTKIHFTSARLLESQRKALAKIISAKNSIHDILGFYANSETGIIGIETPETVDVLDYASGNEKFSQALFGNSTAPSLIIYNPEIRYLEEHEGRILITVKQVVPLIRYDTKDRGGIFNGSYLFEICDKFGYKCHPFLKEKSFAYIYGRSDAVRLLSNIYVDDILYCLSKSNLKNKLTGNFKYGLKESGLRNILKILIYLKTGQKVNKLEKIIFKNEFIEDLCTVNPDYKMVSSGITFNFDIEFIDTSIIDYKGGKFDYHL